MIDPELLDEEPTLTSRLLRQFAAIWLVLFGGLAAWNLYQGDSTEAMVFAAIALAAGPLGLLRPQAIRPLFMLLTALTRPIGALVTRIVLAALFYGLFMPLALLFRTAGRDALNRRRREGSTTYWSARASRPTVRRYFQQY